MVDQKAKHVIERLKRGEALPADQDTAEIVDSLSSLGIIGGAHEQPLRRVHFLLASFLAVSLALIFALMSIFDRPFQGDATVSDEPYRLIRQQVTPN